VLDAARDEPFDHGFHVRRAECDHGAALVARWTAWPTAIHGVDREVHVAERVPVMQSDIVVALDLERDTERFLVASPAKSRL
jgi:hypothetical protein